MTFDVLLAAGGATIVVTLAAALFLPWAIARTSAALSGAMVLLGFHAFGFFRFRMDDSYITYRYARNLADGIGPVWNRGEHVEGYTSFLWMLLLAVMHVVGFDIEFAALLLGIASMIALFLLLWRVWARLAPDKDDGGLSPYLVMAGAGLLVAASKSIGQWSMSGLETPLACALMVALVVAYQRESRTPGAPFSAVILAAAVMTRPEMAFMAAVTGLFFLDQAIVERDARRWRHLAAFAVTFGALAGTWFIWRWSYYGYFYPNTYYVKFGPRDLMIQRGWAYIGYYWWSYLVAPGLIASAVLPFLVRGARRRDAAFLCAIGVIWILAVIQEGGDAFARARFVAPAIAPLYVALTATVSELLRRVPVHRWYKSAAFATAVVLAAAWVAWSPNSSNELNGNRILMDDLDIWGRLLKRNVPGNYLTGVVASGVIPYVSQQPSLDLLGLNDETIAHTRTPGFGTGLPGHEKYNLTYVLEVRRPEIIIVGAPSSQPPTEASLKADADKESFVPGFDRIVYDDRTWQRYEMAAWEHDGLWFPFLVRKDIEDTVHAGWIESKGIVIEQ